MTKNARPLEKKDLTFPCSNFECDTDHSTVCSKKIRLALEWAENEIKIKQREVEDSYESQAVKFGMAKAHKIHRQAFKAVLDSDVQVWKNEDIHTAECECGHPIKFSNGKWRHSTNRHDNYGKEKPIYHHPTYGCKCKKAEPKKGETECKEK